ncbi:heme A synthase [Bradyrhizobium sp. F1.13.4]
MATVRRMMRGPARRLLPLCGVVLLAGGLAAASAGGWIPHPWPQTSAALTPADPGADMPVPEATQLLRLQNHPCDRH